MTSPPSPLSAGEGEPEARCAAAPALEADALVGGGMFLKLGFQATLRIRMKVSWLLFWWGKAALRASEDLVVADIERLDPALLAEGKADEESEFD